MSPVHFRRIRPALGLAALVCAAGVAAPQGLITTGGTVVAWVGDAVPDSTGAPIPNVTFGANLDDCVIDESGRVLFRAQLVDSMTPVTGVNDRAIFYGSSRSTLRLVARGGDQAPGMAPGILLRTASGTSSGLSPILRLSPDGRIWFGSKLYDGGVSIDASNDDAAFAGPLGGLGLLYRDGDVAPGTGGATFDQAFSTPQTSFEGMNRHGRLFTRATLDTGSGVPPVTTAAGMNNQQGMWTGQPGALTLIARKSDPVQGLSGAVAIDISSSLSFHAEMNDGGSVLFDIGLSTTQGAPAATAANDRVLMVHTPGSGNQLLVREGDTAPGTSGGTFQSVSLTDNWAAGLSGSAWLNTNQVIFNTELRGGDTVANVNDKAIYRGGVGALSMIIRRGDVAPGTAGDTFSGFNATNTLHNSSGEVAFQGSLNLVGTVTTGNDTGLWAGLPGSLQLVAREGDVTPGAIGSTYGSLNGPSVFINDSGQVLFANTLNGATPGNSLWVWDAVQGARPVLLTTDQIEVVPGVFKTITSFTTNSTSNTSGAAFSFSHSGQVGLRVTFSDGTRAIMTVNLQGATPTTSFCLGDGTGAACPCANTGAPGRGCASQSFAGGALLSSSGVAGASINTDSLVLTATGIPGPGLFFQATGLAGAPIPLGDGHLCAALGIVRLGIVFPVGGTASYPGGLTPNPIHIGGGTANGDTRHYQCWYRSFPGLCGPQNFNLTQGLTLVWGP